MDALHLNLIISLFEEFYRPCAKISSAIRFINNGHAYFVLGCTNHKLHILFNKQIRTRNIITSTNTIKQPIKTHAIVCSVTTLICTGEIINISEVRTDGIWDYYARGRLIANSP